MQRRTRQSSPAGATGQGHFMQQLFFRFLADESGAAAIEYALIGALISLAIIAGAITLGSALNGRFNTYATTVATP